MDTNNSIGSLVCLFKQSLQIFVDQENILNNRDMSEYTNKNKMLYDFDVFPPFQTTAPQLEHLNANKNEGVPRVQAVPTSLSNAIQNIFNERPYLQFKGTLKTWSPSMQAFYIHNLSKPNKSEIPSDVQFLMWEFFPAESEEMDGWLNA